MKGRPFVRYAAALIAGIVLSVAWPDTYELPLLAFIAGGIMLGWGLIRNARQVVKPIRTTAGIGGLLILLAFGWGITYQRTAANRSDNLIHLADSLQAYEGVVSVQPEERAKTYRVELEICQGKWRHQAVTGWHPLSGRVIVYLDKASQTIPRYGEVWLVAGPPRPIDPPLNPGEFNYKRYLSHRNIYHQQYLRPFQRQVLAIDPPNRITQFCYGG